MPTYMKVGIVIVILLILAPVAMAKFTIDALHGLSIFLTQLRGSGN